MPDSGAGVSQEKICDTVIKNINNRLFNFKKMPYRKDIQMLRGIAVLLVVLFHLDIPYFQNGFLGVDVFFVISGYLMAVLYDKNKKREFFKRRSLRILPAYFITVILTVFASIIIVTPNEYKQVFQQSIYADLFLPNIGYWMQNSYFSKSEFNPLLHLWSLGVEIQYYIAIPVIFYFFRKNGLYLLAAFLFSIILCFILVRISPKTSFFIMPLRAWEFFIGYAVAIYLTIEGNIKRYLKQYFFGSVCFIFLLCIPLVEFKFENEYIGILTGHPGVYALLVAISTGGVLAFGVNKYIERSFFGTSLEIIGKYSYSIYIVHFPIIVLFLYKPFSGTNLKINSYQDLLFLIILILIMSMMMFHLVEIKARKFSKIKLILYTSPVIIILLSLLGYHCQKLFYTKKELLIFNAFTDRSTYRCGKIFRILNPKSITCKITDNDKYNIMLIGNSHADSIKTTFANVSTRMDVGLYFFVPNNPLMSKSTVTISTVIDEAIRYNINGIVLHYSFSAIDTDIIKKLVELARKNNIHVSFIMPVPSYEAHIPKALFDHYKHNTPLPVQTKEEYVNKTKNFRDSLSKITSDNFKLYDVDDYFCKNTCDIVNSSGNPLYFDNGHLTLSGSNNLVELFRIIINDNIQYTTSVTYQKIQDHKGL